MAWNYQLEIDISEITKVEDALEPFTEVVSSFEIVEDGLWSVEAFFEHQPEKQDLDAAVKQALGCDIETSLTVVEEKNWVAESYASFKPFSVGRYGIRGSHIDKDDDSNQGSIDLCIDAATAFGTGEHATTAGCLLALHNLAKSQKFHNILDMGCGSGILGMAAAKTWNAETLAVDNDPESVRVTQENCKINLVEKWVTPYLSDGFKSTLVAEKAPFDLIIANILLNPLKAMAKELNSVLEDGGLVVLSGIMNHHAASLLSTYRMLGMHLVRKYEIDGWSTLVLRHLSSKKVGRK